MSTSNSTPGSWGDPRKGKGTNTEPRLVLKRKENIVRFPTGNPFFSTDDEQGSIVAISEHSAHIAATA